MSDEQTVHQYSKMTLRSRRKSVRDITGGKTLVSRAAKKLIVPALGKINDKIYTEGLWKRTVFPVGLEIKLSTTFSFDEPIKSKHNE